MAGAFIGRERESRLLRGLIASPELGAATVLTGEAGIGKTTLLEHVADGARMQVLWVRGAAGERELPFAALADLLLPLRRHLAGLPPAQRRALASAAALDDRPGGGRLAVCAGTLGLLSAAGQERPRVIVVDDWHLVDAPSQTALAFAARRVLGERVVMLLAGRADPDPSATGWAMPTLSTRSTLSLLAPLPTLPLQGLDIHECAELVRQAGYCLPAPELQAIVSATGGNPQAILEAVRHDVHSYPGGIQVTVAGSIRASWGELLQAMPEATRRALFAVAVTPVTAGPPVAAVLAELGLSLDDLQPAEQRGLVDLAVGVGIQHPLLRQVLGQTTPVGIQSATYRALASLSNPEQKLTYLSRAVVGPDEDLASRLEQAATILRATRGGATALPLSQRSVELSGPTAARAGRLVLAASDAYAAGDPGTAVRWCRQAERVSDSTAHRVSAGTILARALVWIGRLEESHDGLVRLARQIERDDPERAFALYAESILPSAIAWDVGRAEAAAEAARSVETTVDRASRSVDEATPTVPRDVRRKLPSEMPHEVPSQVPQEIAATNVRLLGSDRRDGRAAGTPAAPSPPARALALLAFPHLLRGTIRAGRSALDEATARLPRDMTGPVMGLEDARAHIARGRIWAEQFELASLEVNAAVDDARRCEARASLCLALAVRAELGTWTGQWATGYTDATDALNLADESGLQTLSVQILAILARLDAARGHWPECRSRARMARDRYSMQRLFGLSAPFDAAAGLAALGYGEPDVAIEHLVAARALTVRTRVDNPIVLPVEGDLAEAYVRLGRVDAAEETIAALHSAAQRTGLVYPAIAAARSAGLLAGEEGQAVQVFQSALAQPSLQAMPFERARTLLCQGESMRRLRRPTKARAPLRQAEALFAGLGAVTWAQRAATELAASGERADHLAAERRAARPDAAVVDLLTPQELQIARLVAAGRNNVETGAILFVSRKTVEAHLTRAYRKLEVRSRMELAAALYAAGVPV